MNIDSVERLGVTGQLKSLLDNIFDRHQLNN